MAQKTATVESPNTNLIARANSSSSSSLGADARYERPLHTTSQAVNVALEQMFQKLQTQ